MVHASGFNCRRLACERRREDRLCEPGANTIETATMEAIGLVQRSLGLSAFLEPNPAERLMRDLATYLRQPAPDEALTEAAGWFLESGCELERLGS